MPDDEIPVSVVRLDNLSFVLIRVPLCLMQIPSPCARMTTISSVQYPARTTPAEGTGKVPLVSDQSVPYHCLAVAELVRMLIQARTRHHDLSWHSPVFQGAVIFRDLHLLFSCPELEYTIRQHYTVSRDLRSALTPLSMVEEPSWRIDISCSSSLNSSVASVLACWPSCG
jgi:hypothetical protein